MWPSRRWWLRVLWRKGNAETQLQATPQNSTAMLNTQMSRRRRKSFYVKAQYASGLSNTSTKDIPDMVRLTWLTRRTTSSFRYEAGGRWSRTFTVSPWLSQSRLTLTEVVRSDSSASNVFKTPSLFVPDSCLCRLLLIWEGIELSRNSSKKWLELYK